MNQKYYDSVSTKICYPHYQFSQTGQDLRKLGYSQLFGARPIPVMQLAPIGFTGGRAIKVRRPDIGETGLSSGEIQVAIEQGISA